MAGDRNVHPMQVMDPTARGSSGTAYTLRQAPCYVIGAYRVFIDDGLCNDTLLGSSWRWENIVIAGIYNDIVRTDVSEYIVLSCELVSFCGSGHAG